MRVTKLASFLALAATAGLAVFFASTPATASPVAKIDAVKGKKDSHGNTPDLNQNTSTLGAPSVPMAKCIGCQCHTSKSCAITCCLEGKSMLAALAKRAFYGPEDTHATRQENMPAKSTATASTDNGQAEKATNLDVHHHLKPDVTNPVCRGCPCSETGKLCNYACCVTNAKATAALAIRALRSAVTTDRAPRSVAAAGTGATALVRKDAEDGQVKLRGHQTTKPSHLEEKSTSLAARAEIQVSDLSLKSSPSLRDVAPSQMGPGCIGCPCEGKNVCSTGCCSSDKRALDDNVHVLYPRTAFSRAGEVKEGLLLDGAPVSRDSEVGKEGQVSARAKTHRDLPLLALDGIGDEH